MDKDKVDRDKVDWDNVDKDKDGQGQGGVSSSISRTFLELRSSLVFLGGGEGGKIFWGLPNRFSTNPERIVKVCESA